jgi:hypothetical protein
MYRPVGDLRSSVRMTASERATRRLMLCSRVAQVEHGQCPAPRALPGEDRCELIGPYNKSRDLVFTYERYMYGELTIVQDGTLSLSLSSRT